MTAALSADLGVRWGSAPPSFENGRFFGLGINPAIPRSATLKSESNSPVLFCVQASVPMPPQQHIEVLGAHAENRESRCGTKIRDSLQREKLVKISSDFRECAMSRQTFNSD